MWYNGIDGGSFCCPGRLKKEVIGIFAKRRKKSRKPLRKWQKVILGLYLLNISTFTVARLCLLCFGGLKATLEPHIGDEANREMTYLIAGNLNQPQPAFNFMTSELDANFTYVKFAVQGWNAKATAKAIIKDIRKHNYEARVFAISIGDQVARYLEDELGAEVEIYSINPCSYKDTLQPKYCELTTTWALPAEILCHLLGWPTMFPSIEVGGGDYSLVMLVDQYWEIAYGKPPLKTSCTRGVVLSTNDEVLNNDYLRSLFGETKIVEIDTAHADTWAAAEEYLKGVKRLLEP